MKIIGSQTRFTLEEQGQSLFAQRKDVAIVYDSTTDKYELLQKNDHFAGAVTEINGVGYEFVRSINTTEAHFFKNTPFTC